MGVTHPLPFLAGRREEKTAPLFLRELGELLRTQLSASFPKRELRATLSTAVLRETGHRSHAVPVSLLHMEGFCLWLTGSSHPPGAGGPAG